MSLQLFEEAKRGLQASFEGCVLIEQRPFLEPILKLVTGSMAPASTSNGRHGGFEGGLACHTYDVWRLARAMALGVRSEMNIHTLVDLNQYDPREIESQNASLNLGSVFKVCLLHDLNKVMSLNDDPYYVPNILTSGLRSGPKPWKISDAAMPVASVYRSLRQSGFEDHPVVTLAAGPSTQIREGQASLALAYHLSPGLAQFISEDEEFAVIYHDGAYISTRDGVLGRKSALQSVLHAADMIASGFLC